SQTADIPSTDRRGRRRLETIEEILDIAQDIMCEHGVNGLTLSEVARRLGVQPPSLYKYFDSLMAVYDALFMRGNIANLEVMRAAVAQADPGLDALTAAVEASGRWCVANPPLAQLMFWRPVPSFEPSAESMAPSVEMVNLQRQALADAAAAGQLGPGADSDEALWVVSVFISGIVGQAMANEPGLPWGTGRFTPLLPKLMALLGALYPRHPE
ncbi:MAG TPA: TetR/AcrR family transcriptional regulator, partial [Acidimicrobiales bacterium]|nr:TetR/AcrR family transcriptional regulator [Acidimicrobiales bacterium]